jgi:biopolymer transport protein ExbD
MTRKELIVFGAFVGFVLLLVVLLGPLKIISIQVDLPPAEPPRTAPAKPIFVILQADGRLTIDGAPTTQETLTRDLEKRFTGLQKDQQRIMIRAGGDVPYERFMAVLNPLKAHGWTKIGRINEDVH